MLKGFLAAIAVFMVMSNIGSIQNGIRDAVTALTHLTYWPIRDMRTTVGFVPQHKAMLPPPEGSIPRSGKERTYGLEGIELAERLATTQVNPIAADDSSIARGERKFGRTCVPCHGRSLAGDGPVAAAFMPPPDLLGEATRARRDGYLYSYIRYGGAVMPAYGAQVTAEEAWHVVNYLRSMQKTSPR